MSTQGADKSNVLKKKMMLLRLLDWSAVSNGRMHESVSVIDPRKFTRTHFAWADALYLEFFLQTGGELLLLK